MTNYNITIRIAQKKMLMRYNQYNLLLLIPLTIQFKMLIMKINALNLYWQIEYGIDIEY